jgi:hypothetical protein
VSDEPRVQRDVALLLQCADREICQAESLIHGLRRSYKRGCRCLRCRAANASYEAERRVALAQGKVPMGRRVPGRDVDRRLRSLESEGFTRLEIGRRARLHRNTVSADHRSVTLRTYLRVSALWRRHCGEVEQ